MKNSIRISRVILFILSIFLIQSCEKKPTAPVISTTAVTAISYTTAASGGEVTNEGGAAVTAKGVCWNTSLDPTTTNSKTTDGTGIGSFSSSLTGLTAGTAYYVRAYATNTAGTGYGNQVTFSTNQIALATLTTTAITAITQTTAVSGGNITTDNGGSVTVRGVCWSTSANPTIALSTKTTDGTGTGAFTSSITGLTANTTYYVKAYSTNSAGTAYGLEISFKTSASLPTLTTTSASVITTTTALSGGNITSDGGAAVTARGVCWSTAQNPTTSNYYTTNGSGIGSFTSSITLLTTNTTYYIRAYATNSAGTNYGNQVTAITLSQDIKNIVSDDVLTIITNLGMPMYTGKTPPNLVNYYKLYPNALKNSNIPNDYAFGTTFYPLNFRFYNRDNNTLSVKFDFAEIGSGGGTGTGKGAFISGSGNNFSVFLQVNYTASGQTCDMIEVFSGTMTSTGIRDLYFALFMVDDHGDPAGIWIANGQGRVFYDSDGMSDIIASLSSKNNDSTPGISATAAPGVGVK
ncbi:MAG: hypothetical protein NTX93_09185 [Bacteroidia bacterium]|nr:hypothetical protein [Bacteroidia bacterium]